MVDYTGCLKEQKQKAAVETASEESKKQRNKKIKKLLTKLYRCDNINKLSLRAKAYKHTARTIKSQ